MLIDFVYCAFRAYPQPLGQTMLLLSLCAVLLVHALRSYILMWQALSKVRRSLTATRPSERSSRLRRSIYELIACVALLPRIFGIPSMSRVRVDRKIPFSSEHRRLTLDVHFQEPQSSDEKRPIFVYVHGGAWRRGTSQTSPPLVDYLAARGWVVFSVQVSGPCLFFTFFELTVVANTDNSIVLSLRTRFRNKWST